MRMTYFCTMARHKSVKLIGFSNAMSTDNEQLERTMTVDPLSESLVVTIDCLLAARFVFRKFMHLT